MQSFWHQAEQKETQERRKHNLLVQDKQITTLKEEKEGRTQPNKAANVRPKVEKMKLLQYGKATQVGMQMDRFWFGTMVFPDLEPIPIPVTSPNPQPF